MVCSTLLKQEQETSAPACNFTVIGQGVLDGPGDQPPSPVKAGEDQARHLTTGPSANDLNFEADAQAPPNPD